MQIIILFTAVAFYRLFSFRNHQSMDKKKRGWGSFPNQQCCAEGHVKFKPLETLFQKAVSKALRVVGGAREREGSVSWFVQYLHNIAAGFK